MAKARTRTRKTRTEAAAGSEPAAKKPRGRAGAAAQAVQGAAKGKEHAAAEDKDARGANGQNVYTLTGVESQPEQTPPAEVQLADGQHRDAIDLSQAGLETLACGKASVSDFAQLRTLLQSKVRALEEEHLEKAVKVAEARLQAQLEELTKMAQDDCTKLNTSAQQIYCTIAEFEEKHAKTMEVLEADANKMRLELQKADGKEIARKFVKNFKSQIENMKKDVASTALA